MPSGWGMYCVICDEVKKLRSFNIPGLFAMASKTNAYLRLRGGRGSLMRVGSPLALASHHNHSAVAQGDGDHISSAPPRTFDTNASFQRIAGLAILHHLLPLVYLATIPTISACSNCCPWPDLSIMQLPKRLASDIIISGSVIPLLASQPDTNKSHQDGDGTQPSA